MRSQELESIVKELSVFKKEHAALSFPPAKARRGEIQVALERRWFTAVKWGMISSDIPIVLRELIFFIRLMLRTYPFMIVVRIVT